MSRMCGTIYTVNWSIVFEHDFDISGTIATCKLKTQQLSHRISGSLSTEPIFTLIPILLDPLILYARFPFDLEWKMPDLLHTNFRVETSSPFRRCRRIPLSWMKREFVRISSSCFQSQNSVDKSYDLVSNKTDRLVWIQNNSKNHTNCSNQKTAVSLP